MGPEPEKMERPATEAIDVWSDVGEGGNASLNGQADGTCQW
jgi:hypothetical protein